VRFFPLQELRQSVGQPFCFFLALSRSFSQGRVITTPVGIANSDRMRTLEAGATLRDRDPARARQLVNRNLTLSLVIFSVVSC